MITYQLNFKIFCVGPIGEWQNPNLPIWPITFDVAEFIKQPYKIILTRPYFSNLNELLYNDKPIEHHFNIEDIDLFLFYEFGYNCTQDIINWITNCKIRDYLLLQEHFKYYNQNVISRRYWMTTAPFYQEYDKNFIESLRTKENKKYLFEALLGSSRKHRSFIMFNFLQNKSLLDKSLVSYRPEFILDYNNEEKKYVSESFESNTKRLKDTLSGDEDFIQYRSMFDAHFPYISKDLESLDTNFNINQARETGGFPYKIYMNTWYSIISETSYTTLTITEKIAKMFFTKRIFVLFGAHLVLQELKAMGFKTFSNIIDEDYDNNVNHYERWTMAFDEVKKLSVMDPEKVYAECESILEHNYNRLLEYIHERRSEAHHKLLSKIPKQYIIDTK